MSPVPPIPMERLSDRMTRVETVSEALTDSVHEVTKNVSALTADVRALTEVVKVVQSNDDKRIATLEKRTLRTMLLLGAVVTGGGVVGQGVIKLLEFLGG